MRSSCQTGIFPRTVPTNCFNRDTSDGVVSQPPTHLVVAWKPGVNSAVKLQGCFFQVNLLSPLKVTRGLRKKKHHQQKGANQNEAFIHQKINEGFYKVGPLPVINEVITPLIGVITPFTENKWVNDLPIYFRQFIGAP